MRCIVDRAFKESKPAGLYCGASNKRILLRRRVRDGENGPCGVFITLCVIINNGDRAPFIKKKKVVDVCPNASRAVGCRTFRTCARAITESKTVPFSAKPGFMCTRVSSKRAHNTPAIIARAGRVLSQKNCI